MGGKSRLSKKWLINLQAKEGAMSMAAAENSEPAAGLAAAMAVQRPYPSSAHERGGCRSHSHRCWLRNSCCRESGAGEQAGAVSAAVAGASAAGVMDACCVSCTACSREPDVPFSARATIRAVKSFKFDRACKCDIRQLYMSLNY